MAGRTSTPPFGSRESSLRATRFPRWIWYAFGGLYALSIPWYFAPGDEPAIWLGLPHWVVISLAASVAVAAFTAFIVRNHWPEPEEDWDLGPAPHRPGGVWQASGDGDGR